MNFFPSLCCMRKLILTAILSLLTCFSAMGQAVSHRPEISFGLGGLPMLGGYFLHNNGTPWFGKWEPDEITLDNLYGTRVEDSRTYGIASFSLDIPVVKWFSVPFTFSTILNSTVYQGSFDSKPHIAYDGTLNFLVGARFKYFNREHVNFYSAVQLGLSVMNIGASEIKTDTADFCPAFQLIPFGVRAGGRIYGFAELGVGLIYFGGQVGLGYKF